MVAMLGFSAAVAGATSRAQFLNAKQTPNKAAAAAPLQVVALFGKKQPAKKPAPKKVVPKKSGTVKFTKPKPKPMAKPAAAKKPASSLFAGLFGASASGTVKKTKPVVKKAVVAKKAVVKKPVVKKAPIGGTRKIVKPKAASAPPRKPGVKPMVKPAVKPAASKPKLAALKISAPKVSVNLPSTVTTDQAADVGLASIFAGVALGTLALLPAVFETSMQLVGVGYTGFFVYRYLLFEDNRGELTERLDAIEESTGIDITSTLEVTGGLVKEASKKAATALDDAADKRAEAAAAQAAAKKENEAAQAAVAEAEAKLAAAKAAAAEAVKEEDTKA